MSQASPPMVEPDEALREGYTCSTPWSDDLADVVVICCSSEKYELQHQEFVHALGYRRPHFIQVPGGPAVLYGLAAVKGFLAKAVSTFVDKAMDLLEVGEVILIAHENCGGYKPGRVPIVAELSRRFSRKDLKEVQIEHLRKAAHELQVRLGSGVAVHAFYAHVVEAEAGRRIRFEPIASVHKLLEWVAS